METGNGLDLLTFHHVGLLVEDMEESIAHYSAVFGKQNVSAPVEVSSQKVTVCFVKIADNSFIELVHPTGEDSVVAKLLKKKIGYYHMAYKVTNIVLAVKELENLNYKAMDFFNSEAFGNKPCVFLFSPEGHLTELIEA